MTPASVIATPVRFGLRRTRRRLLASGIVAMALAGAAALIGWSSLAAAVAQENNIRLRLNELTPAARAIHVVHYTIARQGDYNRQIVAAELRNAGAFTTKTWHVQIWHEIAPDSPRGTHIVMAPAGVVLQQGRMPKGCRITFCEALALRGSYQIGQLVRLSGVVYRGINARRVEGLAKIVGVGALKSQVLANASDLGRHALLMPEVSKPLRLLLFNVGSTMKWTAPLNPNQVHGYNLRSVREQLRQSIVRLERDTDPNNPADAQAPLQLLESLADRGDAARARLLLVAGEAAALIVAFAVFAASSRRPDTEVADEQLTTMGATRVQVWLARATEAFAPATAGTLVALAGLWLATEISARHRSLPRGFAREALPTTTIAVIIATGVTGGLLLMAASAPRRARYGIGAIELAAVVSLALVAWQTAATGALDPARVANTAGNPILLLLPALAFFASAVLLLRTLPVLLRLGESLARHSPFALRLAFLTAARSPAQAAAATTFLAVALGGALFSLNYRATLARQAHDQANFTAGASWRAIEQGAGASNGPTDVTPLTRFNRISQEPPTPVIRLNAQLPNVNPSLPPMPVQVLAIPAGRLTAIRGWRARFSTVSRTALRSLLRPHQLRLAGAPIAADARDVRLWARSATEAPRIVVLHFLLPGQKFAFIRLGEVHKKWRLLKSALPHALRSSQLVGLEFLPTVVPLSHALDLGGEVDVGAVSQRRTSGWTPLAGVEKWVAAIPFVGSRGGFVQYDTFTGAPVKAGLQFELEGSLRPLIRPPLEVPQTLPALVSAPVNAAAVDQTVTLQLDGRELAFQVVAQSSLFPTIVGRPHQFVVVDYDTLFAALNADQPGAVVPSEAWFFRNQPTAFAKALRSPPFRLERAVAAGPLATRLSQDPLAAGSRGVLLVAGITAAVLGLLGLVLTTRSTLASERLLMAEYEALGIAGPTLSRAAQLRLLTVSVIGVVAAFAGGLLAVRLIGAFVAVTGTGTRPLPPILPRSDWVGAALVLTTSVVLGAVAIAILVRRVFRESTAMRLRA